MLIENYYTARAKMPEIFRNRGTKFFDRIKALRELMYDLSNYGLIILLFPADIFDYIRILHG